MREPRIRTAGRAWACAALCAGLWVLGGCSKPLLAPTESRSPFDGYDAVRGQYAPQYVENEYGRREANLRGRLSPKQ